jgi:surface polysaccharide O-acyltransferase-like enzyme
MVNINLKTGFVIIAIYEILYWIIYQLTGQYIYSDEDFSQVLLWVIAVPLVAIVIYFLIRWASKK